MKFNKNEIRLYKSIIDNNYEKFLIAFRECHENEILNDYAFFKKL